MLVTCERDVDVVAVPVATESSVTADVSVQLNKSIN